MKNYKVLALAKTLQPDYLPARICLPELFSLSTYVILHINLQPQSI